MIIQLQSLQTEIENHEPRIKTVVDVGQELIDEGHPQSEEFKALIEDLLNHWQDLKDAVVKRNERIHLSDIAQQVCSFRLDFRKKSLDIWFYAKVTTS